MFHKLYFWFNVLGAFEHIFVWEIVGTCALGAPLKVHIHKQMAVSMLCKL